MSDKIQETRHISDGFFILNFGFVCSYLLKDGDSLIAFDAGGKKNKVVEEMEKLNLNPARIKNVLLTHSDPDHTIGLPAYPNAHVYISEAEVAMLNHTTARLFGFIYSKPLKVKYDTLKDGQELKIGNATIECISTPGHTAGSMSFLLNDSILIVGDEMNLNKGKAILDKNISNIDNEQRKDSLLMLAKMKGVKLLCTMHSGYTEDFAKAMKNWQVG
jgi:glyoxylase-like metal-dependent hydrolase (beta-lactamase superfamily II)